MQSTLIGHIKWIHVDSNLHLRTINALVEERYRLFWTNILASSVRHGKNPLNSQGGKAARHGFRILGINSVLASRHSTTS